MSNLSSQLAMFLGLEDNSQVEVNFNIETDSNDESDSAVDIESSAKDIEETEIEVSEEEESEIEAMEDSESEGAVNDALESIKTVVENSIYDGGLTRVGMEAYETAMTAVLGSKYNDVPKLSNESYAGSRIRTTVMLLENHENIQSNYR